MENMSFEIDQQYDRTDFYTSSQAKFEGLALTRSTRWTRLSSALFTCKA